MRKISRQRQLVEQEGIIHSVMRGWRGRFHFENMPRLLRAFGWFLNIARFRNIGRANALKIEVNSIDLELSKLPRAFDGFRVLFISDLHIDGNTELANRIIKLVDGLDFDICLLGGDYSFNFSWVEDIDHTNLTEIVSVLTRKGRVAGVLGNHDIYKVAEYLERLGVEMLMNENIGIERNGQKIYIAGIDDCHYFGSDDLSLASEGIPDTAFKVLLAHSPERLFDAADSEYDVYFAGHTHGGQICLPGGFPIVRGASLRRKYLNGIWQYKGMKGYTSKGAGSSGLDVRFFCRPEITMIKLKCNNV